MQGVFLSRNKLIHHARPRQISLHINIMLLLVVVVGHWPWRCCDTDDKCWSVYVCDVRPGQSRCLLTTLQAQVTPSQVSQFSSRNLSLGMFPHNPKLTWWQPGEFSFFNNEENCAEVVTVRRQTETKLEIDIPRQTVSPTNHQIVSIHNRIWHGGDF